MFTGLVTETGTVQSLERAGHSLHLTLAARKVLASIRLGDSIAVNGVCLTVVGFDHTLFTADVMPETYEHTNLRSLRKGDLVNLERTLALGDPMGGHIVQGHVDGTGTIADLMRDEIALRVTIAAPSRLLRYLVPKGSVALDGVSLTVVDVTADRFQVSLIPHTAANTNLAHRHVGDQVNLEVDILAKYVERLLSTGIHPDRPEPAGQGITLEFLREHGF